MLEKRPGAYRSARRLALALSALPWAKGDLGRIAERTAKAPDVALHMDVDELLGELRRLGGSAKGSGAVLLVDDDHVARSVLEMVVRPYAREVRQVSTIAEANQVLDRERPTAMVVDIELPDGDGRDLLASMQKDPSLASVPRLVLTGRDDPLVRAEAVALGALEVHAKPLDPVGMTQAIAVMLGFEERTNIELTGDLLTGLMGPAELEERAIELRERFLAEGRTWSVIAIRSGRDIATIADVVRDIVGMEAMACRDGRAVVVVVDRALEAAHLVGKHLVERLGPKSFVGVAENANNTWDEAATIAKRMLMLAEGAGEVVAVPASNMDRSRPQVIVVDDDPVVRRLVATALDDEFEVLPLRDGSKLIETLDTKRPTAVILDVGLPGESGLELARRIRGSVRHAKIPLLMLSAFDRPRQIETGLMAGADDYVTKPFDPVTLRARLVHALDRRGF